MHMDATIAQSMDEKKMMTPPRIELETKSPSRSKAAGEVITAPGPRF